MLRLRGETNMRHHRNTGTHQGTNPLGHRSVRLNLDRVRAALLHQANSARHSLLRGLLIRTKRQVGNHHGAGSTARNRRHQRNHLIQGNGQGRLVTEHHIRRGIAHQQHIDARAIKNLRGQGVVAGQHGELLPGRLGLRQVNGTHLLDGVQVKSLRCVSRSGSSRGGGGRLCRVGRRDLGRTLSSHADYSNPVRLQPGVPLTRS